MNRRGFLHTLMGAAVAAQQLDIEKLLWTPGKKTIFIPPASQYVDHWTWRPGLAVTNYRLFLAKRLAIHELSR